MIAPVFRHIGGALALFGALAACHRQAADAAPQPYEIVTQTRPESLDGYLQTYRGLHQVCAATRAAMQLPPAPPLVALPAGFVTERSMYLSSGIIYLTRREEFFIEVAELTPEAGCKSRIASTVTEELVRSGMLQSARRDGDGQREVDAAVALPPPKPDPGSGYSERKTLGGVALRCAPSNATLGPAAMQDLCVPDSAPVPLDGHGEPVIVHARSTLLEGGNVILLTEPISVQIGKAVSPARLTLAGAK
jgi:hypothetical protein